MASQHGSAPLPIEGLPSWLQPGVGQNVHM